MDPIEYQFAGLDIDDDDGPPIYRSGAEGAFESWAVTASGKTENSKAEPPEAEKFRCTLPDAWNDWEIGDFQEKLIHERPASRLVVSLTPHRVEASGAEEERLVCSLRQ